MSAQKAAASSKCEPQQTEIMPLQLAAWMRVRVGTAGYISKLLEKLFARSTPHDVFHHAVFHAGKFARFTLYRTCSACMCSRALPSMRARPCDSAEAALIVVSDLYALHASFPTIKVVTIGIKCPKRFCGREAASSCRVAFAVHRGMATCML